MAGKTRTARGPPPVPWIPPSHIPIAPYELYVCSFFLPVSLRMCVISRLLRGISDPPLHRLQRPKEKKGSRNKGKFNNRNFNQNPYPCLPSMPCRHLHCKCQPLRARHFHRKGRLHQQPSSNRPLGLFLNSSHRQEWQCQCPRKHNHLQG